ncbi:hypothetical protein GQ53DRAFT_793142 [Thozetella sp. PMI_491]|nr:hypothetical protein GQ53DRAFT_793142 [Thozetella sp. PMI_491]
MAQPQHVRVGVAAIIVDDNGRMVMGKRKGAALGVGQWQFPGGHLEMGETYFGCAEREALEESGLKVKAIKLVSATDGLFSPTQQYITLFVLCRREDPQEQPRVLEPHKCEGWSWQTWQDVRNIIRDGTEGVFLPITNLLNDHPDIEALTSVAPQP